VLASTGIAHRFVFKDQWFRPGFLSLQTGWNRTAWDYYRGAMGMLGTFTTVTYPTIQILSTAADVGCDVTLTIIRIG
jgi:hypothetical protein